MSKTKPAAASRYPPTRCVRAHTRSLLSVHGVRIPNHQLGRARGSAFPRMMNCKPTSPGTTRSIDTGHPSAVPSNATCITAIRVMNELMRSSYVSANFA